MFTLEKLTVEDGKYSSVRQGHKQSSDRLIIYLAKNGEDKGHKPKEIKDITKIKVGWQVLMAKGLTGWLNTSPVQEILEVGRREEPASASGKGEDFIRFKTMTSVYELRKVEDTDGRTYE